MQKLNVPFIVLAALIATPISMANAESYSCQLQVFMGPDHDANVKPWVVRDGKIILGYHGDLVPTPRMTFSVIKDDADQLIATQYIPNPNKSHNNIELLMIDKNTSKVAFLNLFPDASFIEHYAGSCTKL